MGDPDSRHIARDSLFIMADLRVHGQDGEHRLKVRNLSAGGLMAEGTVKVSRGDGVQVALRNAGWVEGTVAWVQDNRFGIAFAEEIDPKAVRAGTPSQAGGEPLVIKRAWPTIAPQPIPPRKIL